MNRVSPMNRVSWVLSLAFGLGLVSGDALRSAAADDAAKDGELYTVATAHLDTQWRWTIQNTIDEYIPSTLHDNFALFRKYPDYVFSFEGAFRYMLMKEYYPQEYAELKGWIEKGRWRVAGSWVDAVDTNIPSPESLVRQTLYGNGFFRREFGKTSRDVLLPDCFGFGYALPSVAAHCGLLGFSTQKLAWGSSVGIPFDIGLWEGVNGATLISALNPGDYTSRIGVDLSADSAVVAAVDKLRRTSGVPVAYKYFGTGDTGGAPTDASVAWLEKSIGGGGPVRVKSAGSDELARDLTARLSKEEKARLPHYRGELLMTAHGTGCYTSEAAMKRFNRKNEKLAAAAERTSVMARWLGALPYPRTTLRDAWIRFLWHQFHDDLTGTSIPEAYAFSWNDELISQNQFAGVLEDAVTAIGASLDTRVRGIPLIVVNPLSIGRKDLVEASVVFDRGRPPQVRVFAPSGREVPSQSRPADGNTLRVTFLARVPSMSCAVFDVRPSAEPCPIDGDLKVTERMLENRRYRVGLDENGDVASIRDKLLDRELLAAPLRLQILKDAPLRWAAWELSYNDLMDPPAAVVGRPAQIRVLDCGPALVSLEVTRTSGGSTFRQVLRLSAGDAGNRLEFNLGIDWRTKGMLAKAAFPLSVRSERAVYDLGLGTVSRGTDSEKLYEVPAQEWADLRNTEQGYGVAVLNDCKYGWDKPDDHTLRLTLVRTPSVHPRWAWINDQASMDLGEHTMTYALYGHATDGPDGAIAEQAERLNQPLLAFQTVPHRGGLGRVFAFVRLRAGRDHRRSGLVTIKALKQAEESDEIILRLQALPGKAPGPVSVEFAAPIISAREVNGAEEPLGPARIDPCCGTLETDLKSDQMRTFALRLQGEPEGQPARGTTCVKLPYNMRGFTPCGKRNGTDLDEHGHSFPLELMPASLDLGGIPFQSGPRTARASNLLLCRGQRIDLPAGAQDAAYLLAGSLRGDRQAAFGLGEETRTIWVQDCFEPIGQWDSRLMGGSLITDPASIPPAYLKEDPVGWVGTHLHGQDGGRLAYTKGILYKYRLSIPRGVRTLVLPDDPSICLAALTTVQREGPAALPAQPFSDRPGRSSVRIESEGADFLDSLRVTVHSPNRGAVITVTLDGSTPQPAGVAGSASRLYTGPFTVSSSCTVKARAFVPGLDDRFVASLPLTKLTYLEPVAGIVPQAGLLSLRYEGDWEKLPPFGALTPAAREVVSLVGIPPSAPKEFFGLVQEGFVRVEKGGLYTFHLSSDDGSALYIGGQKLIDNDGLHGDGEVASHVALKAGLHQLRVEYFQGHGGSALKLLIQGPDLPLTEVPAAALSHRAETQ